MWVGGSGGFAGSRGERWRCGGMISTKEALCADLCMTRKWKGISGRKSWGGGQESRGAPVTGAGALGRGGLWLQNGSPMTSPAF